MSYAIVTMPATVLRSTAAKVTNFGSNELKSLIDTLFSIMKEKNGVGIAAPQIGISQSVFVYGFNSSPRYPGVPGVPLGVAINPEIISQSEETNDFQEGCLSVPYKRGTVSRSSIVTFKYQDFDGAMHEKTLHDFAARIVLHEIDHLNGILYIDRAKQVRDSELI